MAKKPSRTIICPHCGAEHVERLRSSPQHNRYFALVAAAFAQWPESEDEQWADVTDFRKWIEMQAGWRDRVAEIPIVGVKPTVLVPMVAMAMRAARTYCRVTEHKGKLIVWAARSVADMQHQEFNLLASRVEEIIVTKLNVPSGDVLLPARKERGEPAALAGACSSPD